MGQGAVGPAEQNVRLDADLAQRPDAVLGGLGLQLAHGLDEGHQGDVDEERLLRPELQAHLADGFQEGQRFDVAHRAADLGNHHVHVAGLPGAGRLGHLADGGLDLVGHVGDDLDGLAQVVAAALLGDDGLVNLARGPVVVAGEPGVGEALVVAQVEVGLRPVVGHVDFAVLVGRHRARVDVQVGIVFLKSDSETATFQEGADRGGRQALTQ